MPNPSEILNVIFNEVSLNVDQSKLSNSAIQKKIMEVCRNKSSRACVRVLMACALAKIDNPNIDIRKPYTEIGDKDAFSGRVYDESYINQLIHLKKLPCNVTTGFLTPAFRTVNYTLTPDVNLGGNNPGIYKKTLELLDSVYKNEITAYILLSEIIRCLLMIKKEQDGQLQMQLDQLASSKVELPLSSEDIVTLFEQHLHCPRSSRLPVLIIAAVYLAASKYLNEQILPLKSHNAADKQTKAIGDVEITILDDEKVVTSYEIKAKRVTIEDIDDALQKITKSGTRIDNMIIITTEKIDDKVQDYAKSMYDETGGIEFVILDCIGFARYFLHLFHRLRIEYLDAYQELLLDAPDSAVSHELKEAFLVLRKNFVISKNSYT